MEKTRSLLARRRSPCRRRLRSSRACSGLPDFLSALSPTLYPLLPRYTRATGGTNRMVAALRPAAEMLFDNLRFGFVSHRRITRGPSPPENVRRSVARSLPH